MSLTPSQVREVERVAKSHLGWPGAPSKFRCLEFVFRVFDEVGIRIPVPAPKPDIENIPMGYPLFLKRKGLVYRRNWTHVVIVLANRECIHISRHFGGVVTITPLEEILAFYDLAES